MVRGLMVAALLAAATLSGCLAEETADTQDDGGNGDDFGGQGNATATGNNSTASSPPNNPPNASLTANVTNGSVPLTVGFELGGEDVDGDNVTWTFDADGDGTPEANGTELPAKTEFTFEEAGNFTAVLTVSDGEASAEANVTIRVEVPIATGPNICDRPSATSYGGQVYTLSEGGTWIFRESNGMPGLQVANTHPTGSDGGGVGFANPEWAECEQGDQMLV